MAFLTDGGWEKNGVDGQTESLGTNEETDLERRREEGLERRREGGLERKREGRGERGRSSLLSEWR